MPECPASSTIAGSMKTLARSLVVCAVALVATRGFAASATHTASRGVIRIKAQLDAVAESTQSEPVKLVPKGWTDLTVVEAVPHGSRVKKGDVLVKLDLDKLREQIEELDNDKPASSLTLDLASAELENLKHTTPTKLEAARRTARMAEEDRVYFESIGRANREKSSRFNLKSAEQRVDGASEELRQLEKMYKADDLTEETEQIVLRRQRFAVEAAQFSLASQKEFSERELKTLLARDHESYQISRREQQAALTLAEETIPKTLGKKQLDFEKLKRDQRKSDRRLADLRADLESLVPRAPMDGMVYYGSCESGRWTTGALVAKKLVPTGKLMANEVFMTIVNTDKLRLHAVIAESELGNFSTGLKGEATPVSAPERRLAVKLDEISAAPLPSGGFDATLSLTRDKSLRLLPGMNCKVAFTGIEKGVAIAVPKGAVFSDTAGKFVHVLKSDGTNEKRTVKTGESDDTLTEITDGLSDGEQVLLKKPEQG